MLNTAMMSYADDDQAEAFSREDDETSYQALSGRSSELVRRLTADRPRHLRFLRNRLPSLEDAEDALQDTTLKLMRHAESFKRADSPDAWIKVALRNTVIDRYRHSASQKRLAESLKIEPAASAEADEPDTVTTIACLKAAVPGLKAKYSGLLQQVYFQGTSLNQVARREQITVNNVAVRLHRARNALRQKMQHQCQTCPLQECWAR
jgi:RNA polymerase sigma-70 factor (ECF subfamily)